MLAQGDTHVGNVAGQEGHVGADGADQRIVGNGLNDLNDQEGAQSGDGSGDQSGGIGPQVIDEAQNQSGIKGDQ